MEFGMLIGYTENLISVRMDAMSLLHESQTESYKISHKTHMT
jgi:hypothetical protein